MSLKNGIKVQPSTPEDFQNIKKLLIDKQYEFHTHIPKIEKPLKVVFKGIPTEITIEEITAELKALGYPTLKIIRMNKKGIPMQMILVQINKEYKSIYNLTNLLGLKIQIEPLKNKGFILQCHRCQIFGHAQANCNAKFKCMKCGDEHSTHICTKPKTTPPKCANCAGEHTSIWKKCPARPKTTQSQQSLIITTPLTMKNPWTKNITNTKNMNLRQTDNPNDRDLNNTNVNSTDKRQKIANCLANMLIDIHQLNPTEEQLLNFNSHIIRILNLTK